MLGTFSFRCNRFTSSNLLMKLPVNEVIKQICGTMHHPDQFHNNPHTLFINIFDSVEAQLGCGFFFSKGTKCSGS